LGNDKFVYSVVNSDDNLAIVNNCYSGYSHDVNLLVKFPENMELAMEFIDSLEPGAKQKLYNYLIRNRGLRDNSYIPMTVEDYICAIGNNPGCS